MSSQGWKGVITKGVRYWTHMRTLASAGHKDPVRQLIEVIILMVYRGVGPGHYISAELFRRDVGLKELVDRMSEKMYRRTCHRLSPPSSHVVCINKFIDKAILSAYGVPTPRLLGYYHATDGRSTDGYPLRTCSDLRNLLLRLCPERVCIKSNRGYGGAGFQSVAVDVESDTVWVRLSGSKDRIKLQGFWEGQVSDVNQGVVLEEHADQHSVLADLHPFSLNTVRVMCGVRPNTDEPLIIAAMLRIGRHRSAVDNFSQGGLVCRLNVASGIVESARTADPVFETFEKHPDTGRTIVGTQVPHWPEAKDLARAVVRLYPGIAFLGIDVGISPREAFIVETNHHPDKKVFEVARIPYRKTLIGMIKKGD